MSKRVAIVLVNWNGKEDTLACLESLQEDRYPDKHLIVVDNGSSDESVAVLESLQPSIELIRTGRNLGFTGGNNLGIRRALELGMDYIFLLNNDTTVEREAITNLVAAAEQHPEAGLLTPVVHYFSQPEEPWFSGSMIDLRRGVAVHDNSSPAGREDAVRDIPWASGCAMLLPAGLLGQLGGFDDRFFLNWEDVDLSLRVRAAGYQILLVPSARIYHKVGQSIVKSRGPSHYFYTRNHVLFVRLHAGRDRFQGCLHAVWTDLSSALRALARRREHSFHALLKTIHGLFDGLFFSLASRK